MVDFKNRQSMDEWRRQHGMATSGSAPAPADIKEAQPTEDIPTSPEAADARRQQSQKNKKMAPFLGLAALACIAGSFYTGMETSRLETYGLRTAGVVTSLKEQYSSDSNGRQHYTYYPIVSYTTQDNRSITFQDSVGSNPPGHHAGDKVTVLYLADQPQKKAIIDRGLWNWIAPAALMLFGALMGWITLRMLRNSAE